MAGEHSSEAEAAMVKGVIDGVTGEDTVLVSVASDTENKAKKTSRILAGEENGFSCTAHVLHLAVHDFLSAYASSPTAPSASTVVAEVRRIARPFRSSPTWSDNLLRMQPESNVQDPLKYIIDVETRWSSLYSMLERALCLHIVTQNVLE